MHGCKCPERCKVFGPAFGCERLQLYRGIYGKVDLRGCAVRTHRPRGRVQATILNVLPRQRLSIVAFNWQGFPAEIPYTTVGLPVNLARERRWAHGGMGSGGHPEPEPEGTRIVVMI